MNEAQKKWPNPTRGEYGYQISVSIKNNATGEVRTRVETTYWSQEEFNLPSDFIWAEGNFSCDCNRALFFYDWGPESEDMKCGHEAFSVNLAHPLTGEVYYREFD